VDKLSYAALEATLLAYVKHDYGTVPVLRMMQLSKDEIAARAEALVARVGSGAMTKLGLEIVDGESVIGGGAAPSAVLPTRLVALTHRQQNADEVCSRLRQGDPPVIARVEDGRVLLDLRTVFPEQDASIAEIILSIT
jgi:L-seryl-tRNA(Ser) seleniumtransferase